MGENTTSTGAQELEPEMTREDLRARLKAAFLAGFRAARQGTELETWEVSEIRRRHDYGLRMEP